MTRPATKLRFLKRQFRAGKLKRGGKKVRTMSEVTRMATGKRRRGRRR